MRRIFMDLLACLMPPVMAAYVAYKGILLTNPFASESDAKGVAYAAHIVVGHPLPQLSLLIVKQGSVVELATY